MGALTRLKHAWNAFLNLDASDMWRHSEGGTITTGRPDRPVLRIYNERSIISSIFTRISVDVSDVTIRHVRLDDQDRYKEPIDSCLDNCLKIQANIDQPARMFRRDIAMSLFEKGVIVVVPIDTTLNPNVSEGFDIKTMRIGKITDWMPQHVRVECYNEKTGRKEEIVVAKKNTAIIENPLYTVMNEPNSTLQRLIRKLNLLDAIDEQSGSGKLDIIIQLPYVVKSEARKQMAEQRRQEIEFQLTGNKYGIAYTDGSEKITQLNRPAENNLLSQIQYLTEMLYAQLGITAEVMNGTADEKTMLNYQNRTVEPICDAIVESMRVAFLTKTARSQKQDIRYFKNPFKLVPIENIAEIADKFTRNEILSSNEVRQIVGFRPVADPKADQLRNSNMPESDLGVQPTSEEEQEGDVQNGS